MTNYTRIHEVDIEYLCVYGAVIFFVLFLAIIIGKKSAAKQSTYTAVNIIHFRIMLIYICTFFTIALIENSLSLNFLIGIMVGLFIYLSLHYVFLFSLIGLCRKSISISILTSAKKILKSGKGIETTELINEMKLKGLDATELRNSRLDQMIYLGFATSDGVSYSISWVGRAINQIAKLIIHVYGLKRLWAYLLLLNQHLCFLEFSYWHIYYYVASPEAAFSCSRVSYWAS